MTDEKNYDVLAAESVAKAVRGSHLVEAVSLTLKYFDGSGLSEKKREYLALATYSTTHFYASTRIGMRRTPFLASTLQCGRFQGSPDTSLWSPK